MIKSIRLPILEDNSVDIMLEIPSIHPSITNVELYVDVVKRTTDSIQYESQGTCLASTELLTQENKTSLYNCQGHPPLSPCVGRKSDKRQKQHHDNESL